MKHAAPLSQALQQAGQWSVDDREGKRVGGEEKEG